MSCPRHLSDMVGLRPGKEAVDILAKSIGVPDLKFLKSVKGDGSINYTCVCWSKKEENKYFIKLNKSEKAKEMFSGEMESIKAIASTDTVNIATVLQLVDFPDNGVGMVMEYLELRKITAEESAVVGEQLARLHLHNAKLKKKSKRAESHVGQADKYTYVDKFGFHISTYHGFYLQNTSWTDDWPTFYARKLDDQVRLLEKTYNCREVTELWSTLTPKIPAFFKDLDIVPSLLHGDFWDGNVAGIRDDGPVVYDPASVYGHSEYDICNGLLCKEFHSDLFDAYFKLIPKAPGFEKRQSLYNFYTAINEWNHFGDKNKRNTLELMRDLVDVQL